MAYKPKPGEIAGVDLFARLQPDGTFVTEIGTIFQVFPAEIEVCGAVYTLEDIKVNELLPDGRGDASIRWGIYV